MGGPTELQGPDLEKDGLLGAELGDGALLEGHAGGEPVLLARRGAEIFAIGGRCTHYGGPLADGLLTGNVVRCPWHHACFDLKTGEATAAPAIDPVACWKVEQRDGRIFVAGKITPAARKRLALAKPERIVVLGAGPAGTFATEMLRRQGYAGEITLVDRDPTAPVDRPNLSKDYLAGNAPEEWIPLRSTEFFAEHEITLHHASVSAIDVAQKVVQLEGGATLGYDALLYALGAEPMRLEIPGSDLEHVHLLRTLDDSRAIITRSASSKRAVVIGASFIGLEVAASLRARGLEVNVVAPEPAPLAKVLGEVGAFVRALHEEHGVRFHLQRKPAAIGHQSVTLDDGSELACDFVVMGVGVRPATALAEAAGIAVERGVLTDSCLATSAPGVFSAGDVARYTTDSGERRRVEHWVHAGRQGQVAALNMLGKKTPFSHVPFFWSAHYDVTIGYVGYAESWDTAEISGSLERRDATIAYRQGGTIRAVATIGRDRASLTAEAAMERGDSAGLEALLKA